MKKKAFTLIEFVMAMTLLSTMLLMIAMLTMRISDIYQKGLALRAVNNVGRQIVDDITRTVQSSPIQEEINPQPPLGGEKNITNEMIVAKRKDYFLARNAEGTNMQAAGMFCTGSYTYVWNTKYAFDNAKNPTNKAITITAPTNKAGESGDRTLAHRFVRIPDNGREFCKQFNDAIDTFNNITVTNPDNVIDLIGEDDSDLLVYDLTVLPAFQSEVTGHAMYPISLIIATRAGGINIDANGDFCTGKERPLEAYSEDNEFSRSDFNYCAVNKFDFVARQSGEAQDVNGYGSK